MPIPIVLAVIFSILVGASSSVFADDIKVGVLAVRGTEKAVKRWYPLVEYLQSRIPDHSFTLIPLSLKEMSPAVANRKVDFVLTNTGNFVVLEHDFNVTPVATLRNLSQGRPVTQFGAVIFTRADRLDINKIDDIRGKKMMGVAKKAFGGFQMAWYELKKRKINPFKNVEVRYTGLPQDQIVYAVSSGVADVGTVRTGILERMHAEGTINMKDFKILEPKRGRQELPFALTTRLYPEWPFAKTASVNPRLAKDVAIALLTMPENDPIAQRANYAGWTVPLDYSIVHQLFKDLSVGPYSRSKEWLFTIGGNRKATMLFGTGITIIFFCLYLIWSPVKRLKQTPENEQDLDQSNVETTASVTQMDRKTA